jgi:hypothetical protein
MGEAFVLATRAGLDLNVVFNAIKGGLAGSTVLRLPNPPASEGPAKRAAGGRVHEGDLASFWADELVGLLRTAWPDPRPGNCLPRTSVCLSSLVAAELPRCLISFATGEPNRDCRELQVKSTMLCGIDGCNARLYLPTRSASGSADRSGSGHDGDCSSRGTYRLTWFLTIPGDTPPSMHSHSGLSACGPRRNSCATRSVLVQS